MTLSLAATQDSVRFRDLVVDLVQAKDTPTMPLYIASVEVGLPNSLGEGVRGGRDGLRGSGGYPGGSRPLSDLVPSESGTILKALSTTSRSLRGCYFLWRSCTCCLGAGSHCCAAQASVQQRPLLLFVGLSERRAAHH